jgi:hypothetical protein
MTEKHKHKHKHKHDKKPWEPIVEREPELNPFVSHQDPIGALENSPPLADDDEADEEESIR